MSIIGNYKENWKNIDFDSNENSFDALIEKLNKNI